MKSKDEAKRTEVNKEPGTWPSKLIGSSVLIKSQYSLNWNSKDSSPAGQTFFNSWISVIDFHQSNHTDAYLFL